MSFADTLRFWHKKTNIIEVFAKLIPDRNFDYREKTLGRSTSLLKQTEIIGIDGTGP